MTNSTAAFVERTEHRPPSPPGDGGFDAADLETVAATVPVRSPDSAGSPPRIVVRVSGSLDCAAAPVLRDSLRAQVRISEPGTELVVDLGDVTSADAHGWTVLLTAADAARTRGVSVRVIGYSPKLLNQLERLGLHRF